MTQLIHRTGNIFTTQARGIGHGVNIRGVMGAGIAKQFATLLPDMHAYYKSYCKEGHLAAGGLLVWPISRDPALYGWSEQYVYNIASQDMPGANASYEWLENGVSMALAHAAAHGLQMIALPRVGSGIGGLEEDKVEFILRALAEAQPVDIELWTFA